ncbi:MAG: alanyl-tRNA synthetase [Elusimicrobia bacterium]|nr:MAG: alanyl-tRNA synthetase [Elusimicrobiota bacterium]
MSDLRDKFLTYFDRKAHHITATSQLVPKDDPTMLFTSAGMVPFKPYFLGQKGGIDRATSCQKCFRSTDIDRVGTTLRHLTFFEMLGNFSFGDYFKEDAVAYCWDFLTNVAGLDPKRLHPTVFKDDAEAESIWLKVGAPNKPVRLGEDTNFWAMGPTGPCGPCSEVYYDLGPEMGSGPQDFVGGDGDRYIEIWNLVFMQFERQVGGALKPLPKKNIDTGMGLERLAMVVEGKRSPFQTSLFEPIRAAAADIIGIPPPTAGGIATEAEVTMAYRIISDHVRASVMLTAEGIIPFNKDRGYVLRRLIRRASRYGRLLGAKEPFLHKLVGPTLSIFKTQYPELAAARQQIEETLKAEESRFLETLEVGERELGELLDRGSKYLPGKETFKLYETYGFPFELTREICARRGVAVSEEEFVVEQQAAAKIAGDVSKFEGDLATAPYQKILQDAPGLKTDFTGYKKLEEQTQIVTILRHVKTDSGVRVESGPHTELGPGDEGEVILLRSPFYPEGGGQVGDKGRLMDDVLEGKVLADVHDTQKPLPQLIVHRVTAQRTLRVGMRVKASVDPESRRTTAYHHTATHLLNEALKRVLGPNIRQAGSLVAPDRLRYDFTHQKGLAKEEIASIEAIVNEAIKADLPVHPMERTAEDIKALGATVLLGEKYGDKPRFLLIGKSGWADPADRFSLELCGGTHVNKTGEIQTFKIVKETAVAAGIRRIEAVAGPALEEMVRREEAADREALKGLIHSFIILTSKIQTVTGKPYHSVLTNIEDPDVASIAEVRRHLPELRELEKSLESQLAQFKRDKLMQQAELGQVTLDVGGRRLAAQKFDAAEPQTLRAISDRLKREMGSGVVFLGSLDANKLSFVVAVTQDLVSAGVDAGAIAKTVCELQGGKGGGRKDFAQGGGPDYDWEELVTKVKSLVAPR